MSSSNGDETIKNRSSEETLRLRESLINVVCYIIRETYLQKPNSKDYEKKNKKRLDHIFDLVRFVVALIDPTSSSSPASSVQNKTEEKEPQRLSRSRSRQVSGYRALYAPLTIIKTVLSASIPDIIYRVLESMNDVGGMTIFWVALSSPVENIRLMTLRLMRVYASAEKKYGKEWRSHRRNLSPYRESLIDHGEALMIQRCLEPFELSVQTYMELREILLGREAYGGSEPERFEIRKLTRGAVMSDRQEEQRLVQEDDGKKFYDPSETERRCAEFERSIAECPSMFLVLFELLPKAKTALQMCAFRELAAMLTGKSKTCRTNRDTIRSNVAWQRWFLYFIVVNSRKERMTKTFVAARTKSSPPPPPKESIRLDTFLSKYDLPKDVRDMIAEASKSKDANESVRILKDVV